jgi:predicted Rossmann fold nucleotide-binding protein DprA/Smf involved in DNA uptake
MNIPIRQYIVRTIPGQSIGEGIATGIVSVSCEPWKAPYIKPKPAPEESTTTRDVILQALKQGPMTVRQIAKETGLTPNAVSKAANNLREKGLIRRVDSVNLRGASRWGLVNETP